MFNDADDLEKKEKAADQHLEHDADHLEKKKAAALISILSFGGTVDWSERFSEATRGLGVAR